MHSSREELDVEQALALAIPLAAEEIVTEEVWDRIADVILSNEHKMRVDRFAHVCALSWAFSKAQYEGKNSKLLWQFLE